MVLKRTLKLSILKYILTTKSALDMGMKGREMFIKRFVGEFYQKSLRKRRTKKNVAYNVPNIINNLCRTYFKVRPQFTERVIFAHPPIWFKVRFPSFLLPLGLFH